MWIVASLFVVLYASLTNANRFELVPIATDVFYKNGVKHERSRYKIVHSTSDYKPYDLHSGKLEHSNGNGHLYSNDNNYNFPKKIASNYKLQHDVRTHNHDPKLKSLYAPRVNNVHEEYLEHIKQYNSGNSQIQNNPTRNTRIHSLTPQVKSSYQNYNHGKCLKCGSTHKNLQKVIRTSISHTVLDPGSSDAEGKIVTPIVTNKAATGSGPGASEYVNSVKNQNSYQGINTRTMWGSMLNGTSGTPGTQQNSIRTSVISMLRDFPDPGTPEYYAYVEKLKAEGKIPLRSGQEITDKTEPKPYPGISEYMTSVLKQNKKNGPGIQQKVFHTRVDSIMHDFPDPGTPEYYAYIERLKTEGKNHPQTGQKIAYEAPHEPNPGISEYITSVLKQNKKTSPGIQQKVFHTRTDSNLHDFPDPGTPEYYAYIEKLKSEGKIPLQPDQEIINEAANEPSTTEHLSSIQHQIEEIKTHPVETNNVLKSGSYSEDTDENFPTHPDILHDFTDGPDRDTPWHIIHSIKIPDPYINAINERNKLNGPKLKTEDNIPKSLNNDLNPDLQASEEHGYWLAHTFDDQPYVPNASDTSLEPLNENSYTVPLSHIVPDMSVPENKAANKTTVTADNAQVIRVPVENLVDSSSVVDKPKQNLVPTNIPSDIKPNDVTLNQKLKENITLPVEKLPELKIPQPVSDQLNFGSFLDSRTYNPYIINENNVGPIENQNLPDEIGTEQKLTQNNLKSHLLPVIDHYYNPDRNLNSEEHSSDDITQESKSPESEVGLELLHDDDYEHEPVFNSVVNYPKAVNDEIVLLDGELVHEPIIASAETQESKATESEVGLEPVDDYYYERKPVLDSVVNYPKAVNDEILLLDGELVHEQNITPETQETKASKALESEAETEPKGNNYYERESVLDSVINYPNAINDDAVLLDGEIVHEPIIASDETQESKAPESEVRLEPVDDYYYEREPVFNSLVNYPKAVNDEIVLLDGELVHEPIFASETQESKASPVDHNYYERRPTLDSVVNYPNTANDEIVLEDEKLIHEPNVASDKTQGSKAPESGAETEPIGNIYYEREPVLDSVINYPNVENDDVVLLNGELAREPIIASEETQESKAPENEVGSEPVDDYSYEREPVLDSVVNYPKAVNDEIVLLDGELVHEPIIASDETQESKTPKSEDGSKPVKYDSFEREPVLNSVVNYPKAVNDEIILLDGELVQEPFIASDETEESKTPKSEDGSKPVDYDSYEHEPVLDSVVNYPKAVNDEIVLLDGELVYEPIIASETQESKASENEVKTAPMNDDYYEPEQYFDSIPNDQNVVHDEFVFSDEELVHEPKVTAGVDLELKVQQNYIKAKPHVFKTPDDYYQHKQSIRQYPKPTKPNIVNENNYNIQNSYVAVQSAPNSEKLHIFVTRNKNNNMHNNPGKPFVYSAYLKSIPNAHTLRNIPPQVAKQYPNRVNQIAQNKVYSSNPHILSETNYDQTKSVPKVIQYRNYYQNFIFKSKESPNMKAIYSLIKKYLRKAPSKCQSSTSKNKVDEKIAKKYTLKYYEDYTK